jgi:pyridoxamine 5'-phosphate oxidase family protein
LFDRFTNHVVRIHPRRVLAWNLDGPGLNARDVRRSGTSTDP